MDCQLWLNYRQVFSKWISFFCHISLRVFWSRPWNYELVCFKSKANSAATTEPQQLLPWLASGIPLGCFAPDRIACRLISQIGAAADRVNPGTVRSLLVFSARADSSPLHLSILFWQFSLGSSICAARTLLLPTRLSRQISVTVWVFGTWTAPSLVLFAHGGFLSLPSFLPRAFFYPVWYSLQRSSWISAVIV